ncbi:MAG TPA: glycosyltransferase family 4 protein [Chloroflexota bacterium]|nr:glycosyltransferase family 4 protein [Chloroflexota bacterium]
MSRQRLRILFLLGSIWDDASVRNRIVNYVAPLTAAGMDCDVAPRLPCWACRLEQWENGTQLQKAFFYGSFALDRLLRIIATPRYDVVVVQRDVFPFSAGLYERLLFALNDKVVYDTDDALHVNPGFASKTIFQRLRPLEKYEAMMRSAKAVVVANPFLMEHALQLNPATIEIPMTIDCQGYQPRVEASERSSELIVGWTGGRTSFVYLPMLRGPLENLTSKLPLVFEIVSGFDVPVDFGQVRIRRKPWRLDSETADIADFDIGVLPLIDGEFERGKFPFKALQYMAAGLPVVASPVGVLSSLIEHGHTGFLAETEADWEHYLGLLLRDPELRLEMGRAARRKVEQDYSTNRYAPLWAKILRETARATATEGARP